jgi:hypothetical protein
VDRTRKLPRVPLARIHPLPLAGSVHKTPAGHDRLRAVLRVADAVVRVDREPPPPVTRVRLLRVVGEPGEPGRPA